MSVAASRIFALAVPEDLAVDARVFTRHVALASLSGLLVTLLTVLVAPGWIGATLAVSQGLFWCARMLHQRPSRWLFNIVAFGLTAGFVELLADAWLVQRTGTLVYAAGGPFLADSPAYMPVAWFGMLTAGMGLGVALRRRWSLLATSVVVALALGVYIPFYEAIAAAAGWWRYRQCALIGGTVPVYIVAGEILIALPLVAFAERLKRVSTSMAVAFGVGQGLWILVSYVLAHTLVGALVPAGG